MKPPENFVKKPFYQPVVYNSCKWFAFLYMRILHRFIRVHLDRVPRQGACLLVSNHQSYFDPPMIGCCVRRRQFNPLARVGLFQTRLSGWLLPLLNSIPLDQEKSDTSAIRTALARLKAGEPVCIFPEGARSEDGQIHEFKRGVLVLLKRANCPIIPMALDGAHEIWPRERTRPKLRGRLGVIVGEPILSQDLLKQYESDPLAEIERRVRELHDELRKTMGREPIR